MVQQLLGGDLVSSSSAYPNGAINWADDYDHKPVGAWSYDLHFAYTRGYPYFSYDCDCNGPCAGQYLKDGLCQQGDTLLDCCVVSGIEKYRDELYLQLVRGQSNQTAGAGNTNNVTEKLLLMSHWIGDVHQPLHVALYDDEGGNDYHVSWMNQTQCGFPPYVHPCEIHEVWDSLMIMKHLDDEYGPTPIIVNGVDQRELKWALELVSKFQLLNVSSDSSDYWAAESTTLAAMAYLPKPPLNVGDHYYTSAIPVVELQLYKAGYRMALQLNFVAGAGSKCPNCFWHAPLCRATPNWTLPSKCLAGNVTATAAAKKQHTRSKKRYIKN